MWQAIAAVVVGLTGVLLLRQFRVFRDWQTRFLIFALWLRYAMAAFYEVTYAPLVAGQSLNALASVAIVAAGMLIIRWDALRIVYLAPLYALIAVIAISGVLASTPIELVDALTKWGYFVVVALLTYDAIRRHGFDRLFRGLAVPFIAPIALQLLSVGLGECRSGEKDGSVSCVGGYSHESILSMILIAFVYMTYFARKLPPAIRAGLIALGVAGIFIANYRTSIVAIAPSLLVFSFNETVRRFIPEQRPVAGLAAFLGIGVALAFVGLILQERFADLTIFLANGGSLIKEPYLFSAADRDIFSGRAYIWSQYLYGFAAGDILTYLFGYGPNAWVGRFEAYAHNTFVSYLYEYGFVGALSLMVFMTANLVQTLTLRDRATGMLLAACHFGFVLLNLATMPLWSIEGTIAYAFLCGYSWSRATEDLSARARSPRTRPSADRPMAATLRQPRVTR